MSSTSAPIFDRIRIIPRPDDFLDRNYGNSGEIYFDQEANSLRFYDGNTLGGYTTLTDYNLTKYLEVSGIALVKYNVTIGESDNENPAYQFYFDNLNNLELQLVLGYTYIFDQSHWSNEFWPDLTRQNTNLHILTFNSNINGTGQEITENVIYKLNNDIVSRQTYLAKFATSTQRSIQITPNKNHPTTFYYVSNNIQSIGNKIELAEPGVGSNKVSINVSPITPNDPISGSIWFNDTENKLYVFVDDGSSIPAWISPKVNLTDLGIADGNQGQVLTSNGNGTYVFQDPVETIVEGNPYNFTIVGTDSTVLVNATSNEINLANTKLSSLQNVNVTDIIEGPNPVTLAYNYETNLWESNRYIEFDANLDRFATDNLYVSNTLTVNTTFNCVNVNIDGTISTTDSSAITFVPAVIMNSDLLVENSATIRNNLTVGTFSTLGSGTPELTSNFDLLLTASTRVDVTQSPLKFAQLTTAQRDALPEFKFGDTIFNITLDKIQTYVQNAGAGAPGWVSLH